MRFDELCLVICLLVILPVLNVRRSLRDTSHLARRTRYIRSTILITTLSALAFASWSLSGRSWAAAGFDWPLTRPAQFGMTFAVIVLFASIAWSVVSARRQTTVDQIKKQEATPLLPQNSRELWAWIPFAFAAGCGWEWLYRGFLLGVLTPHIGQLTAIIVAAIAYGIGHGVKDRKRLFGSCISALLFTVGYALTHSLWWLMLIHTASAVIVGFWSTRLWSANRHAPELAVSHK